VLKNEEMENQFLSSKLLIQSLNKENRKGLLILEVEEI
jgi:hypothetical protein